MGHPRPLRGPRPRATVVRYLSRFKFISAVPVGDVGIHGEFDGRYRTRSKGPAADERVDFRPIVSRRRAGLEPAGHRRRGPEYVAGATNPELPGRDVLRLYDGIGAPMRHPTGTSKSNQIKSFLLFTSSTKGDLQALRLPPRGAHLLPLLLHPLQGQPEEGGVQAAAGAGSHPGVVEVEIDPIEPFSGDNHTCHDPYLRR